MNLYARAERIWLPLERPSKEMSRALETRFDGDLSKPLHAINAGYATRLAQLDESALVVSSRADKPDAALSQLLDTSMADERFFSAAFPLGESVWQGLLEAWMPLAASMGTAESRELSSQPAEFDRAARLGYLAASVDQAYGLSPRRSTDIPSLPIQLLQLLLLPLLALFFLGLFVYRFCRPSLLLCLAAIWALADDGVVQFAAIAAATLNALFGLARFGLSQDSDVDLWLLISTFATGCLGGALLLYGLFF